MTEPPPAPSSSAGIGRRGRGWARAERYQGTGAVLAVVALIVLLATGGAFGRTGPAVPSTKVLDGTSGHVRGVTADTVRIVLYQPPENDPVSKIVARFVAPADDNARSEATVRGFIKALAASYAPFLHGRHIELIPFTGSANLLDSVAARADAVKIAQEVKPFMVWNGPLLGTAFADELASRGVMCIMCVNAGTNAFYAAHAPYVWSLETSPEQVGAHTAEYVQKRLAGRDASFAGTASLRRSVRRFGLLSVSGQFGGTGLGPSIADGLHARGLQLAANLSYGDANAVNQVQATMIGRLKDRGVTTVIYAGDPIAMGSFMVEATAQGWFPEWVMTGGFSSERSSWGRGDDPRQMAHAFGITPLPAPHSSRNDPVFNIYRNANHAEPPARQSVAQLFAPVYMFFAGLVSAKGDLTPARFRQGLFDAEPIGGLASAPSVPMISFGRRGMWPYTDYAGIDDFTEIWWNPRAVGVDEFGIEGRGMWEFADGGRRYRPGAWPTGPPQAFVAKGAVTVLD